MKKIFLPASLVCLLTVLIAIPTLKARSNKTLVKSTVVTEEKTESKSLSAVEVASNLLYDSLKLADMGLSKDAMLMAYKGQQVLAQRGVLNRDNVVAICDFSQSSKAKRLYIIDTKNYQVLMNTYVAHGKNSGLDYAENFSNRPESLQSSLGFYVTKNTYFGKHGLSLKLSGQENGFNNNAESRAVVIHGANYIGDNRLQSPYMGRSFGCPAVPQELSAKVIDLLKDGTCLFIYSPNQAYLHGSKILNG
ncbi:murein L,D-transpeptidase catalytic domain family protein [Flavisolibacter nicotianae]|uniref:murein L,D-transpeptidase catalytic domain family protein n=1 Tax=Flavisolibacter nicotianae TaxID=2364882 RepID=UPI0013C4C752|nr:murein L,D-transpeptidase catalytic domain family protein [Flavisolibacter nicotianae]